MGETRSDTTAFNNHCQGAVSTKALSSSAWNVYMSLNNNVIFTEPLFKENQSDPIY